MHHYELKSATKFRIAKLYSMMSGPVCAIDFQDTFIGIFMAKKHLTLCGDQKPWVGVRAVLVEIRLSLQSLFDQSLTGMKLEVGITEHAHLGTVETIELSFLADAKRCDEIADLEPHVGHDEAKDRDSASVD